MVAEARLARARARPTDRPTPRVGETKLRRASSSPLLSAQARLAGAINQVDGFLHFERETDVLRDWDGRITSVSLAVNECLEAIAQ